MNDGKQIYDDIYHSAKLEMKIKRINGVTQGCDGLYIGGTLQKTSWLF